MRRQTAKVNLMASDHAPQGGTNVMSNWILQTPGLSGQSPPNPARPSAMSGWSTNAGQSFKKSRPPQRQNYARSPDLQHTASAGMRHWICRTTPQSHDDATGQQIRLQRLAGAPSHPIRWR
jgi:hypothetical protein